MAKRRLKDPLLALCQRNGWRPLAHQLAAWDAFANGISALVVAPTGSGKTLALAGGILRRFALAAADPGFTPRRRRSKNNPMVACLKMLWITPLKALAVDTQQQLIGFSTALGCDLRIVLRTGDSSSSARAKARRGDCEVLVTTPESLALMLSYPDAEAAFAALDLVVIDEWHELLGSKRGVLLELGLARLRAWRPQLVVNAASASLANVEEALEVLCPQIPKRELIRASARREIRIDSILPAQLTRFPFAGHLGLALLREVLQRLSDAPTSLVFCNVRSQAELWYQALLAVWPFPSETLALHHGSLSSEHRFAVEQGLRDGSIRAAVCTSALDLGVDYPAVEQVIQIGSPRGVARLIQRAGRSQHRPNTPCQIVLVPTHSFEVIEFAALREAIAQQWIEPKQPLQNCLDVLIQHLLTIAAGSGFDPIAMRAEVRQTHAFATLSDSDFAAALDVICRGGSALAQYPDFQRVENVDGRYVLACERKRLRHRLGIGTITADAAISVRMLRGKRLGEVEEGFIARLAPGAVFHFAGKVLQFVRTRDMDAYVRPAARASGPMIVPRWGGGALPISATLGTAVRRVLGAPAGHSPECAAAEALLALQNRVSHVPQADTLLVEHYAERATQYLFLFPFGGRVLHEGLAALLAVRISQGRPVTIGFAANDYGLALISSTPDAFTALDWSQLLDPDGVAATLPQVANLAELARRKFREIARIVGFTPPSLPGRAQRSVRQLQASSGMLFDVLQQHDPNHPLLKLAFDETLQTELCSRLLVDCLRALASGCIEERQPKALTPFSFPLWAENQRGTVSNESWRDRVARAAAKLDKRYGPE